MEHKESLRVLGLTEHSTLQDLSSTFRKLSKKYHPDLNRDREEWSNRQMRFLNEAYRTAHQYLSLPLSQRIIDESIRKEKPSRHTRRSHNFAQTLHGALQLLYSSLEVYYQYGLDNIALRREGTRRSRYNSSIRKIKRSFTLLKPLAEQPMSNREEDELETVVHFIRYFYKSMHIRTLRADPNTNYERKAFQHYIQGAGLVDDVIKEILFNDMVEPYKRGRLAENIKLAEAELNSVIIDFSDALCSRETEIKKELLYAVLDLADLQDEGRINFY